jgi:hypothetical protein
MSRQGFLVGFLAGGWLVTLVLLLVPHLGLPLAGAEDPSLTGPPAQPFGPNGPQLPGPTVNPVDANYPKGETNSGVGTSDANRRSIALSASVGGGVSVVYYFDTVAQRLCIYQYSPGNRGGLKLLAARLIEYDLKLEGYRDVSEKTPREMRQAWESAQEAPGAGRPGALPTKHVEVPGSVR